MKAEIIAITRVEGTYRVTYAADPSGGADTTLAVEATGALEAAFSEATETAQAWLDAERLRVFKTLGRADQTAAIEAAVDERISAKRAELADVTAQVEAAKAEPAKK